MVKPTLPEDIVMEIFLRLPAKSIGKCRCLSKQHRSLLSTPEFIKNHLHTTQKTHQENLILVTSSKSIHCITNMKHYTVSTKLDLPNSRWFQVVGSCDGFVLRGNLDEDENWLVNPITMQQMKIPNSPVALDRSESLSHCGFGYDICSDDYKIVKLSFYDTFPNYTFVDVYSLRTGVWTRLDFSPYDHDYTRISYGCFVNGALHWKASCNDQQSGTKRYVVAAFDLASQVFHEISTPIGLDMRRYAIFGNISVLGGCLCMINPQWNAPTDIWILKEYGVRESWTKFSIDQVDGNHVVYAICFIGDKEEIVLVMSDQCLAVYNMKDGSLRSMAIDGAPFKLRHECFGTFVGSLLDFSCFPAFDNN